MAGQGGGGQREAVSRVPSSLGPLYRCDHRVTGSCRCTQEGGWGSFSRQRDSCELSAVRWLAQGPWVHVGHSPAAGVVEESRLGRRAGADKAGGLRQYGMPGSGARTSFRREQATVLFSINLCLGLLGLP